VYSGGATQLNTKPRNSMTVNNRSRDGDSQYVMYPGGRGEEESDVAFISVENFRKVSGNFASETFHSGKCLLCSLFIHFEFNIKYY
jgi:hypothetical protein